MLLRDNLKKLILLPLEADSRRRVVESVIFVVYSRGKNANNSKTGGVLPEGRRARARDDAAEVNRLKRFFVLIAPRREGGREGGREIHGEREIKRRRRKNESERQEIRQMTLENTARNVRRLINCCLLLTLRLFVVAVTFAVR